MTAKTPLPAGLTDQDRVVLFDGVCNVCESSAQFIIRHDPEGKIKMASLQSEVGQQLLAWAGLPREDFDTMVFIEGGRAWLRSTAALRVARHLRSPWHLLGVLLILPAFVRDLGYKLIASNRYRWFGQKTECMMPTPDIRARFLSW